MPGPAQSTSTRLAPSSPFNFTAAIRSTCESLAAMLPELKHVDMSQVAVGFCQARKRVPHGLQASLTPMRFEGGAETTTRRGRRYACQRLYAATGEEYLYLLNFYLPRFLNHDLGEKLTTIVHELWHISPAFDGDLRRHEGRCYVHGPSQRDFDRTAAALAATWLASDPPAECYAYLRYTFPELVARYGGVQGERFKVPRLIPVAR